VKYVLRCNLCTSLTCSYLVTVIGNNMTGSAHTT